MVKNNDEKQGGEHDESHKSNLFLTK